MAFTKIDGVTGAADSYRGTSGVDELGLNTSNAWVGAQPGNDRIAFAVGGAGASNYTFNGGAGNDTFFEQGSTNLNDSVLKSDDGNDIITISGTLRSTISGGVGLDQISTSGIISSSLINGNQNDDLININAGATSSSIYGGIGQDSINLTTNITSTSVRGNEGNDIFDVAAGTALNSAIINGNQGDDLITINAISAFTNTTIFGGTDNDTVNAAASAIGIVANGDDGNDQITGGTAGDSLTGGAGNDNFTGGDGNDIFTVDSGIDAINDFGFGGADEVITTTGTVANATVIASNAVTATSSNSGTLNATLANAIGNSLVDFNLLTGNGVTLNAAATNAQIQLVGSAQNDTITGGAGTDTLTSGTGINILTGGAANDDFIVGAGTTSISDFGVGNGDDIQALAGATVNATLTAVNTVSGASDNTGGTINVSTVTATQLANNSLIDFENLTGNAGVTIDASSQLAGNGVRAVVTNFNDTVTGGDSADSITGGLLADSITGGLGADRFQYTAVNFGANATAATAAVLAGTIDTISDFAAGDLIGGVAGGGAAVFDTATLTAGSGAGYANYGLAQAAAIAAGNTSLITAVGAGGAWTAFLFDSTGAGANTAIAGVQLGATGQFANVAAANAAITVAQIVA